MYQEMYCYSRIRIRRDTTRGENNKDTRLCNDVKLGSANLGKEDVSCSATKDWAWQNRGAQTWTAVHNMIVGNKGVSEKGQE